MNDKPINHEIDRSPELQNSTINIGDPQTWIDLYKTQTILDDSLNSNSHNANTALKTMLDLTTQLHLETSFTIDATNATGLMDLYREVESAGEQLNIAQQKAVEAYQKVTQIYGEVGFKEWELGCELEAIEPAEYITRAIGTPLKPINKRYLQVRAEIEIFRQLTGENRKHITLGYNNSEPWIVNKFQNTVLNIQKLQLAQIVLSENPLDTAISFGKETIINKLGLPPILELNNSDEIFEKLDNYSWYKEAEQVCKEIEPLENGLSIDQISM